MAGSSKEENKLDIKASTESRSDSDKKISEEVKKGLEPPTTEKEMEAVKPKAGEGKEPTFKPAPDDDSLPTMEYDKNDPPRGGIVVPKGSVERDFPEQPVDNLNAPPPAMVSEPIAGHPPAKDDVIVNEFDLEVPPAPALYTDTWPVGKVPDPPKEDLPSYAGAEPKDNFINPLASVQENAAKINERLIKQCIKGGMEYWAALNILKYAVKTLGTDFVRVRDKDKELPQIRVPEPVET